MTFTSLCFWAIDQNKGIDCEISLRIASLVVSHEFLRLSFGGGCVFCGDWRVVHPSWLGAVSDGVVPRRRQIWPGGPPLVTSAARPTCCMLSCWRGHCAPPRHVMDFETSVMRSGEGGEGGAGGKGGRSVLVIQGMRWQPKLQLWRFYPKKTPVWHADRPGNSTAQCSDDNRWGGFHRTMHCRTARTPPVMLCGVVGGDGNDDATMPMRDGRMDLCTRGRNCT